MPKLFWPQTSNLTSYYNAFSINILIIWKYTIMRAAMLQQIACKSDAQRDLLKINRGPHPAHCSYAPFKPAFTSPRILRRIPQVPLQRCAAAEQATFSVADLPEATQTAWEECSNRLEILGLSAEDTEKTLVKAFGWASQAYWRNEKIKEDPVVDQVEAVLDFLTSIGIASEADQAAIITKFPEVLGLEVELMQENVEKLQKAFFLKGPALLGTLKRKPRVLGTLVDCEGSCQGLCTRCFAHF